jgi:hypothetical protein
METLRLKRVENHGVEEGCEVKRRTLNPVVSPEMKLVGQAGAISRVARHREPRA